MTNDYKINVSE